MPETEDDRRLASLLRFHTLDCELGAPGGGAAIGGAQRWGCLAVKGVAGCEELFNFWCQASLAPAPPRPTLSHSCPFFNPLPAAYEDKQKLKRTEIISRSWFPSAPGPGSSSSKASSVLKKLAQGRRNAPSSCPITVEDLGIVRRPRDVPGSPQPTAEKTKSREPQAPQGTTQDRPASSQDGSEETANPKTCGQWGQEGIGQDKSRPPSGSSQEAPDPPGTPQPGSLSSSLVADYSDSESE